MDVDSIEIEWLSTVARDHQDFVFCFPRVRHKSKCPCRIEVEAETHAASRQRGNAATLPMIDSGANLAHRYFDDDRNSVIEYARDQTRLEGIIVTGTSFSREQAHTANLTCKKYPGFCWRTVGVHPHNAERELARLPRQQPQPQQLTGTEQQDVVVGKMTERIVQEAERAPAGTLVAIGETGLDYARTFSFHEDQKHVLKAHLHAARRLGLPLYLHERDAFEDFIAVLDEEAERNGKGQYIRGVVRCFTGGETEAVAYVRRGLHLSFSGTICMPARGAAARDVLQRRLVPADRMLLDSDAPHLLPRSANGLVIRPPRNEPCTLGVVAQTVAHLTGMAPEEVEKTTAANARQLFLSPDHMASASPQTRQADDG